MADAGLLGRLWPVVDPALDALPAGELIDATLDALREAFQTPAAALEFEDGAGVLAGIGIDKAAAEADITAAVAAIAAAHEKD